MAGGRLPLAAALLPVAPAGRRLRHQRLLLGAPRDPARSTTCSGCSTRPTPGASGSSPTWSSTTPATSTRGSSSRARAATTPRPTGTCGTTTTSGGREARVVFIDVERSNWAYDPMRDQYYWHRFYSHQPDLNYENPEVADAMLDVVRFWLDLGPRRLPPRRRPLPLPAGRHRRGEPPRDPRLHPPGPGRARRALPGPDPAGRGQRVAGRRGRLLRRRRRVPPVLQLPPDAPAVHGRPARAELPDHRDPGPDPGGPRRRPVGHLPAQPRRADPGDGHRGGARLPLRRVRQGPADEAAHGHRPTPGPAARPGPPTVRAALLPAVHPAREPGPLLRGRDPDGGQPLPRRPRLGADPDAVDP